MSATSNESSKAGRKLGSEWADWDGEDAGESRAGKRVFIFLAGLFLGITTILSVIAWYMVAPRLSQWHAHAPGVTLVTVLSLLALSLLCLCALGLALWRRWPLPRSLAGLARRMLATTEGQVLSLGRTLSVNSDRTAHSMIKIHNALTLNDDQPTDPERVLVLLPRCLTREQLKEARDLTDELGVKVAVVSGGELARKRILENSPETIIGVACERDLVSGLRDMGRKFRVLGLPNTRPNGPCKDTAIDMSSLREVITFSITGRRGSGPAGSGPTAENSSGSVHS